MRIHREYKIKTRAKSKLSNLLNGTPEAYCWVGFLFADGYINHKDLRLSLRLSLDDEEHLERFREFIECSLSIKTYRNACSLDLRGNAGITSLINKFDFKPRKTYNPPDIKLIPDEMLIPFLTGFIDGDGHIEQRTKTQSVITIGCHVAWFDVLVTLKTRLYSQLGCSDLDKVTARKYNDKGTNMVRVSIANNYVLVRLGQIVRHLNLPMLVRKWNKLPTLLSKRSEFYLLKGTIVTMLQGGASTAEISRKIEKPYSATRQYIGTHKLKESIRYGKKSEYITFIGRFQPYTPLCIQV